MPGGDSGTLLAGSAMMAVAVIVAALLAQAGFWVVGVVTACLSGLGLLFFVLARDPRMSGATFAIGFVGLLVTTVAALLAQSDVVLFGSSAHDVVAADAPRAGRALLHFCDARVLAERVGSADVWAGSKGTHHVAYTVFVAPIVDAGWTPDRPVGALAVIGNPQLGHRRSEWREPWNGGIALSGADVVQRRKARDDLARTPGLIVAPDAVFVRWVADPEAEAAAARWRLLRTIAVAAALWCGLALAIRVFTRRRA